MWLYHCFSLSLREVELILAQRGIVVSYESIRAWGLRFGRAFANSLKRRRPQPGDKWHLDEVFIRIRGKLHYLWRAIDQHGTVLDILVQSRRNAKAAKRFFKKLLKGLQYVPRVIVTDKLRSYGAAKRKILPGVEHRQSRYLNNRFRCVEVWRSSLGLDAGPLTRRDCNGRRRRLAGAAGHPWAQPAPVPSPASPWPRRRRGFAERSKSSASRASARFGA